MTDEEKSIMELYEQYLDESELERIKEQDEADYGEQKTGVKLTKKSVEYKFENEDTISIHKYMNYLFASEAPKIDKVTHAELKKLGSPYVVTVDNDFADQHPERVKRGELLIVIDDRGNRGTYINPESIKQFLKHGDVSKAIKVFLKKGVHDLKELDKYWSKCTILQSEIEANQSFLELLMETNRINKINEIREYMELLDSLDKKESENKGGRKK